MTYTALYRKYRPLTFDEVVGQHDVVETLKNKILTGKIGHAILLTGSRGTGKTTLAKIFARAINCQNPHGANPCNECSICKGILSESMMDVIEMDAASNNGVDDVRALNEKVKFPPSVAKYKVFIVDEVHMMSKPAFNAFLKTLEEPPGYILFIFATTDPQAIPNTILSRCQRFDLKRVKHGDIFLRLEKVCQMAELEYTGEGLELIVRRSEGAVRDALGFLDKVSSYGKIVDKSSVTAAIGLVDDDILFDLSDAIIERRLEDGLLAVNRVIESGRNEAYFLIDLQDHFRNMMMITAGDGLGKLILRDESYINRLIASKGKMAFSRLIMIIERLGDDIYRLKHSENTRITLETAIARLCVPDPLGDGKELTARIEALEKAYNSMNTSPASPIQEKRRQQEIQAPAEIKLEEGTKEKILEEQVKLTDEVASENLGDLTLKEIQDDWDRVLSVIQRDSYLTSNYMFQTLPIELEGILVTIGFSSKQSGFYERMSGTNRLEDVEKAMFEVFGVRLKAQVVLEESKEKDYTESDVLSFFDGFEDRFKMS